MGKYFVKVDITNTRGALSKEHGQMIEAGSTLEFEKDPERVRQLLKIGVLEQVKSDEQPPQDPPSDDNDQDNQDPPADETQAVPDHLVDILKNNVDKVVKTLKDASIEDLMIVYNLEKNGQNRKTVIEYIESQMAQ